MAKTIVKKTISIQKLIESLNYRLANTHETSPKERQAMMSMIEDILHETGNYNGFVYLEQHEVPLGCKPGIKPYSEEGNVCGDRFINTDPTRVRYI